MRLKLAIVLLSPFAFVVLLAIACNPVRGVIFAAFLGCTVAGAWLLAVYIAEGDL